MKLKDLSKLDRPREKIEQYGSKRLEDHELLAAMLGSGIKGLNVIQLAKKILKTIGKKEPTLESLIKIKGLGKAKAIQILAAFELGRRRFEKNPETILTPQKVFELCADFRDSKKEHLAVFYLNTRNGLLSREIVSIGTIDESVLHPREVFEPALKYGAAKILLAHNHPSGEPEPSLEDIEITRKIKDAGELMGIELLDHIILTRGQFLSFKLRKVL